jgi:hypothetical protein
MQAVHSEFKSDDNTKEKAENALLWMKSMVEGSSKFGKPLNVAPEWKTEMENAGFVDVEQKILKVSPTLLDEAFADGEKRYRLDLGLRMRS